MERRLGLVERLKLKLHMWVCAWCKQYLLQLEILRKVLQRSPSASEVSLSPDARSRIAETLKRELTPGN